MSISGPSVSISAENGRLMRSNIDIMNSLGGFDVIVICCSNENQAKYWKQRLDKGKGSIIHAETKVLAVFEDWPGGAGNALGTLYAYHNAMKSAQDIYHMDLNAELSAGKISIGLFHTAGKGTRLAPLPASENNNKPGVKIPSTITLEGKHVPVTILESVIKQTGSYASSRKGRLSVFWGDQVFIPTASCQTPPKYHADILCSLGPMMSEADWMAKGMDKYGLIAQSSHGAAQVEKVDHATAVKLLASLGEIQSVGASLGSFSVSNKLLDCLMHEFASELAAKKGKLDSDPHLWMPMTLTKPAYIHLMQQKGVAEDVAAAVHDRIAAMIAKFNADTSTSSLGLFGPVDVGQEVLWWDYGQLPLYQKNTLRLTEDNDEAELMRHFYGVERTEHGDGIDATSCVTHSIITSKKQSVERSVLSNVRCNNIHAQDAILINVTANKIVAPRGSILYNVIDSSDEGIILGENDVRVGVFSSDKSCLLLNSSTAIDGGKSWEKKVLTNPLSFEEVYNANATADPTALEHVMQVMHDEAWSGVINHRPVKRPSSEMDHH